MNRIIPFRTPEEQQSAVPEVVAHLRSGGIILYPTETVYGFGSALLESALAALAAMKSRTQDKPFLILVLDADVNGVEWTAAARTLATEFWPGPLTIVLHATPDAFPQRVAGEDNTVALRATPHPGVRMLIKALGQPITSTSANLPGQPPATSFDQARAVLQDIAPSVDVWLLDGGALAPSPPSTIIDGTVQPPRLIRRGAIDIAQLAEIT
jgi:L-threonylcarbamoyladenylate synthase